MAFKEKHLSHMRTRVGIPRTHTKNSVGVVPLYNPNAQDGESEQAGKPDWSKPQALGTGRKRALILRY